MALANLQATEALRSQRLAMENLGASAEGFLMPSSLCQDSGQQTGAVSASFNSSGEKDSPDQDLFQKSIDVPQMAFPRQAKEPHDTFGTKASTGQHVGYPGDIYAPTIKEVAIVWVYACMEDLFGFLIALAHIPAHLATNPGLVYATGRGVQEKGIRVNDMAVFQVHTERAGASAELAVELKRPGIFNDTVILK